MICNKNKWEKDMVCLLIVFLFLFVGFGIYEYGSVYPRIHKHKWYLYDVITEVHKRRQYICVESRCTICGKRKILVSRNNIKEVLN